MIQLAIKLIGRPNIDPAVDDISLRSDVYSTQELNDKYLNPDVVQYPTFTTRYKVVFMVPEIGETGNFIIILEPA